MERTLEVVQRTDAAMLLLRGIGISGGGAGAVEKPNKHGIEILFLISKTILL